MLFSLNVVIFLCQYIDFHVILLHSFLLLHCIGCIVIHLINLLLIDVFSFFVFVFLLLQSVQQWLSSCICHITCDGICSQKWNCWVKGNTHFIFLYIPSCHPKRLYQFILSKTLSYYFPTASPIWYIISLFIFVSLIGFSASLFSQLYWDDRFLF